MLAGQETFAALAKDPYDKAALIYENGYLGTIKQENLEAILKCVKASLVSRRQLYMKQFMKGLDSYGLEDIIKQNPKVSEAMFVIGRAAFTLPDANYLFSLMVPTYSEKGSTKQALEVKVMDHLQDLLIEIEDAETKELCDAPVAWKSENETDGSKDCNVTDGSEDKGHDVDGRDNNDDDVDGRDVIMTMMLMVVKTKDMMLVVEMIVTMLMVGIIMTMMMMVGRIRTMMLMIGKIMTRMLMVVVQRRGCLCE